MQCPDDWYDFRRFWNNEHSNDPPKAGKMLETLQLAGSTHSGTSSVIAGFLFHPCKDVGRF